MGLVVPAGRHVRTTEFCIHNLSGPGIPQIVMEQRLLLRPRVGVQKAAARELDRGLRNPAPHLPQKFSNESDSLPTGQRADRVAIRASSRRSQIQPQAFTWLFDNPSTNGFGSQRNR